MSVKTISMDKIRGLVNMGREAQKNMEDDLRVRVLVDLKAEEWLICAVRDALVPERDAQVEVGGLAYLEEISETDVGIVVADGSDAEVRTAIRTFVGTRRHVIVVAHSSLDIPQTNLPSKLGQYASEVIAPDRDVLFERLASAVLDATDKDVPCAANFAFCRDAATARLVSKCAARNAFMSVADFIPGAGMPLMTMNQINLCFDMAACYGHGLSAGRIPEVAAVACAGFAYRWAAQTTARLFPFLSLVIQAGFAYGGTLVTGRMLSSHYSDAQIEPVNVREDIATGVTMVNERIEQTRRQLVAGHEDVPQRKNYITIGEGGVLA